MQLYFVEYCRELLVQNQDKFSTEEHNDFEMKLIGFEFAAYDRLNWWDNYIHLFEETLKETRYVLTYSPWRDDPVFNSYVLRRDRKYKYVHFLYLYDRRYKVICKKLRRAEEGKGTEHLKRHQQHQLSEEELNSRYDEMRILFEFLRWQSGP